MVSVLVREDRHKRDNVASEEETGALQPQAGNAGATRRTPLEPPKSFGSTDTDFRILALRTVSEYIFVILSHLICGNLLW